MATRIKQHKGAWWIFINHKGKRKAKRIGSSKRAAEIAAEKIQAKITLGQFEIKDEKTSRPFDVHFRHWLDTYVRAHCKERTHWLYKNAFEQHLLPTFGKKDITNITRDQVKTFAYGHLIPGGNKSAVDKLDGLENATLRNPDATNETNAVFKNKARA